MNQIENIPVGDYSNLFSQITGVISFSDVRTLIGGDEQIKNQVLMLRALKAAGLQEEAQRFKKNMRAVSFSAIARNQRILDNITTYNQLLVLDFDHIPDKDFDIIRSRIESNPHSFYVFRSPSGDGLKVLVRIDSMLEYHKLAFHQVADYYSKEIGFPPDYSGSDPLRLCILSHDQETVLNPNALIFQVDKSQELKKRIQPSVLSIQKENHAKVLDFILDETTKYDSYENGNRNNFIHQLVCNLNRAGVPENDAFAFLVQRFTDLSEYEIKQTLTGVYQRHIDEFATVDYEVLMLKNPKVVDDVSNTPILSNEIYSRLPGFLRMQCSIFSEPRERDVFLLSFLGLLSGALLKYTGTYRSKTVYSNLYIYIVAPSASNKGVMDFVRAMGMTYHKALRNEYKTAKTIYIQELEQYNMSKAKGNLGEMPLAPKNKGFYIPGNSSSAALLKQLNENDGNGVICESEGDTIGNMLKQEWGNFSDIFRKAFHHEYLSISRKTTEDCFEIENPRLSLIITSTPDQVAGIIQSANNGLFSRMSFYLFKSSPTWQKMDLSENEENLDEHFRKMGETLNRLINRFNAKEVQFKMKATHKKIIDDFGEYWMKEVAAFVDEDATSTVKRFGLNLFRIAMILTAVRDFDDDKPLRTELICNDNDAETALMITETLLKHAITMFKLLPKNGEYEINSSMRLFFDLLPKVFSRKDALLTAERLNLSHATADKYLSRLLM